MVISYNKVSNYCIFLYNMKENYKFHRMEERNYEQT